jgi:hypothetical protein
MQSAHRHRERGPRARFSFCERPTERCLPDRGPAWPSVHKACRWGRVRWKGRHLLCDAETGESVQQQAREGVWHHHQRRCVSSV